MSIESSQKVKRSFIGFAIEKMIFWKRHELEKVSKTFSIINPKPKSQTEVIYIITYFQSYYDM